MKLFKEIFYIRSNASGSARVIPADIYNLPVKPGKYIINRTTLYVP